MLKSEKETITNDPTRQTKSPGQLRRQYQLACDYCDVSPDWQIGKELKAEIGASIDRLADEIQVEVLKREIIDLQDQSKNIASCSCSDRDDAFEVRRVWCGKGEDIKSLRNWAEQ